MTNTPAEAGLLHFAKRIIKTEASQGRLSAVAVERSHRKVYVSQSKNFNSVANYS